MKMNKGQIIKKVQKIEAKIPYTNRCIQARVCPKCGETIMASGSDHPFLDKYVCLNEECKYIIMI